MRFILVILLFGICTIAEAQKATSVSPAELTVPELIFDSAGDLKILPSASSSKYDFGFFEGKWQLQNKTLKKKPDGSAEWIAFESTQEMHIVLNGIGNIDNFLAIRNGKPFEGMTVRLFNPQTRLWSIYWADSNYGVLGLPPVMGSFENKVGHFFSKDLIDGKIVFTVYRWDARNADKPIWSQATSEDGKTWEWNWFMYMTKVK